MLAQAINETAGIGIGAFLGTLLGFYFRSRNGNRSALIRDSVALTAVAVGMLAWTVAVLFNLVTG